MRRMKIFFATLLSICLLLSCGTYISAAEMTENTSYSTTEIINLYKGNRETIYTVQSTVPLLGLSQDSTYTLYLLNPYGYVILLDETMSFMEGCYSEDIGLDIFSTTQSPIYYGGPGVYCVVEDNNYYNLATNSYLSSEEVDMITTIESQVSSSLAYQFGGASPQTASVATATSGTSTTYSVAYDYFSSHTDFGYNVYGTCTVIAAQMLLNYYDNYVNDAFIPTNMESGNGSSHAFHNHLNSYVYGSEEWGGIHIQDAAPGINAYLLDEGLHYGIKTIYLPQETVLSKIVSTLQGGKPIIASMGRNYGAWWNHSVLIYSVTYKTEAPTLDAVYTMNMGWRGFLSRRPEYKASASWFYACGYMEDYSATHTLSSWTESDSCYHTRECLSCDYYEISMHSDAWDSRLNKCLKCGRTGFYEVPVASVSPPVDEIITIEEGYLG